MSETCKHCGGAKGQRNPTGECDHLYWPDNLTDEAKVANGYQKVATEKWIKRPPEMSHDLYCELNGF